MRLQGSRFLTAHLIAIATFACPTLCADPMPQGTGQLEFKLVYDACGSRACSRAYVTPDGLKVGFDAERFPSPSLAATALNKHLKLAVKILERSPKLNERGEVVGERVVARFKAARVVEDQGGPAYLENVLWTYATDLYVVIPPEKKCATGLEAKLRRGPQGWLELKK